MFQQPGIFWAVKRRRRRLLRQQHLPARYRVSCEAPLLMFDRQWRGTPEPFNQHLLDRVTKLVLSLSVGHTVDSGVRIHRVRKDL